MLDKLEENEIIEEEKYINNHESIGWELDPQAGGPNELLRLLGVKNGT